MIHVIATITVANAKRATLLDELQRLVPTVRAEDGCIAYAPTVDAASGLAKQRADTVVMIEQWRDLAALQAHLAAPHMLAYRERVKPLAPAVQLQVLQPA